MSGTDHKTLQNCVERSHIWDHNCMKDTSISLLLPFFFRTEFYRWMVGHPCNCCCLFLKDKKLGTDGRILQSCADPMLETMSLCWKTFISLLLSFSSGQKVGDRWQDITELCKSHVGYHVLMLKDIHNHCCCLFLQDRRLGTDGRILQSCADPMLETMALLWMISMYSWVALEEIKLIWPRDWWKH